MSDSTRIPTHPILLSVDPGGRKTGLARSGRAGIATPVGILSSINQQQLALKVAEEIEKIHADACIIGLPLNADGKETGGCRRSRSLGQRLENMGYRVYFQPEYLTTREARERAGRIGREPSSPVDDLAAAILLEDFLDANKNSLSKHDD